MKPYFQGWYFKHQKGEHTLCLIKAKANGQPFLQILADDRAFCYDSLHGCTTGRQGVTLALPEVAGTLRYGPFTAPQSDIMGPLALLPLGCQHTVVSLRHALAGSLVVEGQEWDFTGGRGYIEGDRGRSFPQHYLWLQCNAFSKPCSIMAAAVHTAAAGVPLWGVVCSLWIEGQEYRLASYLGATVLRATAAELFVAQGRYSLSVELAPAPGAELKAPVNGCMTARVNESSTSAGRFRFWENGVLLFDQHSRHVSLECSL